MSTRNISGSIRLVAESKGDAELLCHTLNSLPVLGQVAGVTVFFASPRQGRRGEWLVYGTFVVEVENE